MILNDKKSKKDKKSNQTKISKDALIRTVARQSEYDLETVREIHRILERTIFETLHNDVDENNNIAIKLFDGITIEGNYMPEADRINNITGAMTHINAKIKPKACFTRYYCDKLSDLN